MRKCAIFAAAFFSISAAFMCSSCFARGGEDPFARKWFLANEIDFKTSDKECTRLETLLGTAREAGYNGVMISSWLGLDVLHTPIWTPERKERLMRIKRRCDDLGLEMVHFYVGGILANDSDLAKLRQVKEMQLEVKAEADVEAYKLQILSEARAKARAVEGYTYQEERKYDVLESAAENNGNAGGMIGAGLGLGVGLGVIDETKRMTQSSFAQDSQTAQASAPGLRVCPNCQTNVPKQSKFCPECGNALPPEVRFCTECGSKLDPGCKFCPQCGTKVN